MQIAQDTEAESALPQQEAGERAAYAPNLKLDCHPQSPCGLDNITEVKNWRATSPGLMGKPARPTLKTVGPGWGFVPDHVAPWAPGGLSKPLKQ